MVGSTNAATRRGFRKPLGVLLAFIGSQAQIALGERQYAAARQGHSPVLRRFWNSGYLYVVPIVLLYFVRIFIEQNALEQDTENLGTLQKYSLAFGKTKQIAQRQPPSILCPNMRWLKAIGV